MDVKLAVACEYANVSREGKLNISGVSQEVTPPIIPYQMPRLFLVASFEAGPAEFGSDKDIGISLIESDGQQLMTLNGPLNVPAPQRPGDRTIINQILTMENLTFPRSGDYAFHILVNGEEKTAVPIRINEPLGT